MLLLDAREAFRDRSGKLSDIVRQLSFAGVAVVWIFVEDSKIRIPPPLLAPALCFVLALMCDVAQYAWATGAWGIFHRLKEKELGLNLGAPRAEETQFYAPHWINWPTNFFLWAKVIALLVGYSRMAAYIFMRIAGPSAT